MSWDYLAPANYNKNIKIKGEFPQKIMMYLSDSNARNISIQFTNKELGLEQLNFFESNLNWNIFFHDSFICKLNWIILGTRLIRFSYTLWTPSTSRNHLVEMDVNKSTTYCVHKHTYTNLYTPLPPPNY